MSIKRIVIRYVTARLRQLKYAAAEGVTRALAVVVVATLLLLLALAALLFLFIGLSLAAAHWCSVPVYVGFFFTTLFLFLLLAGVFAARRPILNHWRNRIAGALLEELEPEDSPPADKAAGATVGGEEKSSMKQRS